MPEPVPPKPAVPGHLVFYWDAFWELSADRPLGFSGVGRIPFTALDAYATRYGLTGPDAFDRFRQIIRAMDAAFRAELSPDKPPGAVAPDDLDGVRRLLRRVAKPDDTEQES